MPVWRDEGSGAWVLTRHDDVRAVLNNSTDYSSDAMGGGSQRLPLPTAIGPFGFIRSFIDSEGNRVSPHTPG